MPKNREKRPHKTFFGPRLRKSLRTGSLTKTLATFSPVWTLKQPHQTYQERSTDFTGVKRTPYYFVSKSLVVPRLPEPGKTCILRRHIFFLVCWKTFTATSNAVKKPHLQTTGAFHCFRFGALLKCYSSNEMW